MRTYQYDPETVNIRRVAGLAADAGGSASLRQTTREDGSPGVPILDVTVPDGVSAETVEGWVAEATGVSDVEQAAWEALRLAAEAAAHILDPSTPTEIGVDKSFVGLIGAVLNPLIVRVNTLSAAASPSMPALDLIDPQAARQYASALAAVTPEQVAAARQARLAAAAVQQVLAPADPVAVGIQAVALGILANIREVREAWNQEHPGRPLAVPTREQSAAYVVGLLSGRIPPPP